MQQPSLVLPRGPDPTLSEQILLDESENTSDDALSFDSEDSVTEDGSARVMSLLQCATEAVVPLLLHTDVTPAFLESRFYSTLKQLPIELLELLEAGIHVKQGKQTASTVLHCVRLDSYTQQMPTVLQIRGLMSSEGAHALAAALDKAVARITRYHHATGNSKDLHEYFPTTLDLSDSGLWADDVVRIAYPLRQYVKELVLDDSVALIFTDENFDQLAYAGDFEALSCRCDIPELAHQVDIPGSFIKGRHSPWNGLKRLDFSGMKCDPITLLSIFSMPTLESLTLTGISTDPEEHGNARFLRNCPRPKIEHIVHLSMTNCSLHEGFIDGIASSKLQTLDISISDDTGPHYEGSILPGVLGAALGRLLVRCPGLQSLNLLGRRFVGAISLPTCIPTCIGQPEGDHRDHCCPSPSLQLKHVLYTPQAHRWSVDITALKRHARDLRDI